MYRLMICIVTKSSPQEMNKQDRMTVFNYIDTMKTKKIQELSEGQLWRLKKRYVLVVALENLCVRFKLMDGPDKTSERTLTGDIDTLYRYLVSRHARLV